MLWILFKLVLFTFVPLPIHPKITRPDPKKNFWTFTCDEFKSPFQIARKFYLSDRDLKQNYRNVASGSSTPACSRATQTCCDASSRSD